MVTCRPEIIASSPSRPGSPRARSCARGRAVDEGRCLRSLIGRMCECKSFFARRSCEGESLARASLLRDGEAEAFGRAAALQPADDAGTEAGGEPLEDAGIVDE